MSACWIVDRDLIGIMADIIGQADATMFSEPTMWAAFLENVRFDAPDREEVEQGLSLASLELGVGQRVGLLIARSSPSWLIKLSGVADALGKHSRRLVRSSAGLCLVVAPDARPQTDIVVGRMMQRAWLALTEHGLAAQPMMSLAILENASQRGTAESLGALRREKLIELRSRRCSALPQLGDARVAAMLRFGFAAPPSGRVGRLPLSASVREVASDADEPRHAPSMPTAGRAG